MIHLPLKAIALATSLTITLAATPAAAVTYVATLSRVSENPANTSLGTGSATLTIVGDIMTLTTSFSGLMGNVIGAHVSCCDHRPVYARIATPLPYLPGFPIGVTSGSYSQSFDLNLASTYSSNFIIWYGGEVAFAKNAFLAGLDGRAAYLGIHTDAFRGGEIRGRFAAVPEPTAWMLMIAGFGLIGGVLRRRRMRLA